MKIASVKMEKLTNEQIGFIAERLKEGKQKIEHAMLC